MRNFEKAKRITAMALILCMLLCDVPGRTFNHPSLALAEESSENNNPEDTIIESKEELQDLFEIPVIGTIPNFGAEAGHSHGGKYGYGYGRKAADTSPQEQQKS